MLRGIDISSHQPIIDWARVKAAGYSFVVIKLTGGNSYVNKVFWQQYNGARAAGLAVGIYHYDGEPTVSTGTAEQEAAHFLAHLPNPLQRECFLALDAEERATRDPARYRRWLDIVRQATGERPYLYTFKSFVTELGAASWEPVKDFPLWYAWYPEDIDPLGNPPPPPAPWASYLAWQYSGGTSIPGIPNATDANAYFGTVAELSSDDGPVPTPTPDGAVSWRINERGETIVEINYGGVAAEVLGVNIVDVGVSVRNAAGEVYDRSVRANAFERWVGR